MADRFVILSGPSYVGKDPLKAAIKEFYKEIKYYSIPVIKSRESRPGCKPRPDDIEWDNPDYFRMAEEIRALNGNPKYLVGDCRGWPQAVDLEKVSNSTSNLIFIEIYHTLGTHLKSSDYLKDTDINSVFLSPLSKQEIADLKASGVVLPYYLEDLMRHKLAVRTRFQRKKFTEEIITDNLSRARDAYSELKDAHNYTHILVNHDGEGNPDWHRLLSGEFTRMPEGDAYRVMDVFAEILKTGNSASAEHWEENTF